MLTEKKRPKLRKLSGEILGLLAVSVLIALVLIQFLSYGASGLIENVLFMRDIELTAGQLTELDNWVFNLSFLISVSFFVILFLFLLGERLSYIKELTKGVTALQNGQQDYSVPLKGSNELTQLAEAINYLSITQRQIREQERALSEEKEQFIRALSHDIRTPLTSILSYSELLAEKPGLPEELQEEYLALIRKKAGQIKELTDVLLDGGQRMPESFENARVLLEQLAWEFEEALEEEFSVSIDLTGCPAFSGTFDVQELRRIFDNLISNVQKYADPEAPVTLQVRLEEGRLVIHQENAVLQNSAPVESYRMGLNSIRRIAHHYAGQVTLRQDSSTFAITITFSDLK